MTTPSPVEIISIDIAESVIKKNLINLPKSRVTTAAITTATTAVTTFNIAGDNTDYMRDKFMNAIADNGNKISTGIIKSSYPGQAKQIIATETGESQIFCEVGSLHDTGTNSQNNDCINDIVTNLETLKDNISNIKCEIDDNTISEGNIEEVDGNLLSSISDSDTIRPDIVNVENSQTSQDDIGDSLKSEVNVINDEQNIIPSSFSAQKNIEVNFEKFSSSLSIAEETGKKFNEPLSIQTTLSQKSLMDLSARHDEIDGRYRKSILTTRKSPNRGNNLTEQVVPKMNDAKDLKKQKVQKKIAKKFDSMPLKNDESCRKNYLGSLESINASKPMTLSKKSKSFEFIKTDFSLKEIDINEVDTPNSPQKSSSSTNITVNNDANNPQHDNETIDELCSVCCYGKNQVSNKNLYTVHSNNSSPLELDSAECELCSSYNLQDNEVAPGEPQCELCEICGDVALDMDVVASSRPETDELIDARIFAGSRHVPLNVAKRKIASGLRLEGKIFDITDEDVDGEGADDNIRHTSYRGERLPSTSVEEYSADDSTLDDVEFEIENCGLDTGTTKQSSTKIIANEKTLENVEIMPSERLKIDKDDMESKRMIRGSSLITRNAVRPDSKRRYSSVDNLPSSKQRQIKSTTNESMRSRSKNQSKVAGSVDNIRVSRITKDSNRLRKSADDVAKGSQDTNECSGGSEKQLTVDKKIDEKDDETMEEHRVGTDTIKFIISKHGLKIISDKEIPL
ncbi:hypothetical protein PV328_003668 [Microctonus aethiopoides]|uniref:Uncharacterized protein n=1 Tax=Microctonus aethiopoides TaxID=144406 RepID=A0AA39F909_9HYME|nr:hypothetical protein PV328_003668 [Microctonus aethiopoides]